jgi:DNA repair and recombination RAD54-like protein
VPIAGYSDPVGLRPLGMSRQDTKLRSMFNPDAPDALVLYRPADDSETEKAVVVDPNLSLMLRPHQREGVRFLYDCVTGRKVPGYSGAIMADEMGLGKTFQLITLVWTLLTQSPTGNYAIQNVIVVVPSALVPNWAQEFRKWLGPSGPYIRTMDGGSKEDTENKMSEFVRAPIPESTHRSHLPVLIVSYETLRQNVTSLHGGHIGLIIADEGHRLKNTDSQLYKAMSNFVDYFPNEIK